MNDNKLAELLLLVAQELSSRITGLESRLNEIQEEAKRCIASPRIVNNIWGFAENLALGKFPIPKTEADDDK